MQRKLAVVGVAVLLVAGAALADGIDFQPTFTPADLAEMSESLGDSISFPLLGPASASGLAGFELLAVAGGPRVDTGDDWWQSGVDGSAPGGILTGYGVVARKGLPGGFDIGVQGGRVLDERFWGAEVRWAFLRGGVVEPGACLRLVYSRFENAPIDLEVKEVQLAVSKGLTVITPFVAVGYRQVESAAWFGEPELVLHEYDDSRVTGEAGVRFNLTLFRFVAAVRQGAALSYFVGFGIGL